VIDKFEVNRILRLGQPEAGCDAMSPARGYEIHDSGRDYDGVVTLAADAAAGGVSEGIANAKTAVVQSAGSGAVGVVVITT
jgi:hypothetical protein